MLNNLQFQYLHLLSTKNIFFLMCVYPFILFVPVYLCIYIVYMSLCIFNELYITVVMLLEHVYHFIFYKSLTATGLRKFYEFWKLSNLKK